MSSRHTHSDSTANSDKVGFSGQAELSKTGKAKRWLWLLLVCVVIFVILAGLKFFQVSKAIAFASSFPERSESVTAIIVRASSLPKIFRTIGEVQATQYVELRTEVDGKISEINFNGGEAVEKDQLMIQLDSSEERAQLRATRAQLKLAELQLKRASELRNKNLASKNDVDIAKADKDVLFANVAALLATIDKKTLKAPFAADTGVHNLQVGQYLNANSLITELSGGAGQYWVDFDLPQDKATLSVGDTVAVSAHNLIAGSLNAKIVSAESRIDASSRSRGYRALIVEVPVNLRPGAVVDIEANFGVINDVFRLPASAVRRSNFGASVYVLNLAEADAAAKHRAVRKQVNVRGAEGSEVFIDGGLQAGEIVAAIGAFKLEDGLLVNIVERVRDKDNIENANTSNQAVANETAQ